jgi:hypothetical protein
MRSEMMMMMMMMMMTIADHGVSASKFRFMADFRNSKHDLHPIKQNMFFFTREKNE